MDESVLGKPHASALRLMDESVLGKPHASALRLMDESVLLENRTLARCG
jgi:hypothetical protein